MFNPCLGFLEVHISRFTQEVYDLLEKYNVSLCLISAPGNLPENTIQTSDMVYLRFHGKDQWYKTHIRKPSCKNGQTG